jgi:hypothetical protein
MGATSHLPLLIDVAIPLDRNVIQKEAEKELKYKNRNSANFSGATEIVTTGLKKVSRNNTRKAFNRMSKKAVLETMHRICKVLQSET